MKCWKAGAAGVLVVVLAASGGCGGGNRTPEKSPGPAAAGAAYGRPAVVAAVPVVPGGPPVPTTLAGLWRELEQRRAQLRAGFSAGRLDSVGATGARIAELVRALPSVSRDYVPTRQGPLEDVVRRVDEIAGRLVRLSGTADTLGVKDEVERLDDQVRFARTLYPPGIVPKSD